MIGRVSNRWKAFALLFPIVGMAAATALAQGPGSQRAFFQAWWTSRLGIPTAGLLAEYLFNEGIETSDTSGNGYGLNNAGAVTFTNGYAVFNGTSTSLLTINSTFGIDNTSFLDSGFSVSFWIDNDGKQEEAAWDFGSSGGSQANSGFYRNNQASGFGFRFWWRSPTIDSEPQVGSLLDWTHVVCTASANGLYVYVNGAESSSYTNSVASFNRNRFAMGGLYDSTPSTYYSGKLDTFRVYNRVLEQFEIDLLYAEGGPE